MTNHRLRAPAEGHGTRIDVGSLRPVAAEEVASIITEPHRRKRVVQLAEAQRSLFDVAKVLRAAQRGAACRVDLSDGWDPFPVAELPLDRICDEYGIPPRGMRGRSSRSSSIG